MPATTAESRTDELLVVRCQLGEREAFDALIRRWHDPLWRYLRRFANSSDVANDLAQDTWLRILRGIASLRDGAMLRPWLFTIARRTAIDRLRLRYAREEEVVEAIEDIPRPMSDADLDGEFASLEQHLDELPVIEREILTLFYLRELSLGDIAALIGVPTGTVKSRLFRARQKLRRSIESTGETA